MEKLNFKKVEDTGEDGGEFIDFKTELTGSNKNEAMTENSVEGEINEQKIELNKNLLILKDKINKIGGISGLKRKIEELKSRNKDINRDMAVSAVATPLVAFSALIAPKLVYIETALNNGSFADNHGDTQVFITQLVAVILYGSVATIMAGVGVSSVVEKIKTWIEKRKLIFLNDEVKKFGLEN